MFGCGYCISTGSVHHNNSTAGGFININIVNSGTGPAYYFELFCILQYLFCDLSSASYHKAIIFPYDLSQFLGFKSDTASNLDFVGFLKDMGTSLRNVVTNKYFQIFLRKYFKK